MRTNYVCLESELESETEEQWKIGNTDWCQCGESKTIATSTESLCCLDTSEVYEELLEGYKCIKKSSGFRMICLEKSEFHATILPLNHLREDPMKNIDNISYRSAGYKQYTCWEHNYLEKVVRKVIASSVV